MPDISFHHISPSKITLDSIRHIVLNGLNLSLSTESQQRIRDCRAYLDGKIAHTEELYYGINTGFGSLCNIRISDRDIEQLQYNLVVSHAAGTGDEVPPEIVRIMLLLKIQSLSYGYSAVREKVVERLIDFYNADMTPVVFELGSLGASGDLAPLAHLSLPLIGLGEMWHEGKRQRADVLLQLRDLQPLTFKAKEALALLNGTQFSSAYAVWCLLEARRLARLADLNAAIGFDAFNCRYSPLDANIHRIRPQAGQVSTAKAILALLEGSELSGIEKKDVQDPYAFRCVPQVHGATRNALAHIEQVVETEINSVTDNPNIFPEEDLILSGGNFHAQALALPLDYLGIALSELGNISERRIYQLIGGQRGLPAFLTDNPGLHSGMMIAQYTAAAIVSQNKGYSTPASVDSIISCNGQEDHVSMAANAATKARRIVLNLERLLAIEFMVVMQALEFRLPHRSSPVIEALRREYRGIVPRLESDRVLHNDIETTITFLRKKGLEGLPGEG
ncbi:MAG: histidine ammonia-lyase [Lewinellaceae bacterium]|nr:histidine ammonia-lyase [Saprospiraceae bacterium]MCB9356491.1 histidine ammonia-lyase [Lewinellaceae bacterium]